MSSLPKATTTCYRDVCKLSRCLSGTRTRMARTIVPCLRVQSMRKSNVCQIRRHRNHPSRARLLIARGLPCQRRSPKTKISCSWRMSTSRRRMARQICKGAWRSSRSCEMRQRICSRSARRLSQSQGRGSIVRIDSRRMMQTRWTRSLAVSLRHLYSKPVTCLHLRDSKK